MALDRSGRRRSLRLGVLVGWSQARPQDLVSRRLADEDAVRTAGLILGGVLVVIALWWLIRGRHRHRD
ncbi:hypothetical protein [Micropruina sonneratiae]|uniref:hypothetical protein n=1 Tax=Micropruina sonneratiae TaxID=2986940 RepID=UPI002225C6A9|nr:hypothetical protein [Micropruina sp. KQZ13P-5]MCW3156470.1 hypothetical protein [Micropruina sp. KQZ13P-5]